MEQEGSKPAQREAIDLNSAQGCGPNTAAIYLTPRKRAFRARRTFARGRLAGGRKSRIPWHDTVGRHTYTDAMTGPITPNDEAIVADGGLLTLRQHEYSAPHRWTAAWRPRPLNKLPTAKETKGHICQASVSAGKYPGVCRMARTEQQSGYNRRDAKFGTYQSDHRHGVTHDEPDNESSATSHRWSNC